MLTLIKVGFGCHECRYKDLIRSFLLSLPFGFLLMFLANVGIFHGINNFSAELVKFADRLFYTVSRTTLGYKVWCVHTCLPCLHMQDWWTSRNYATYYRKWNNVVHHCIHQYLYQDVKNVSEVTLIQHFPASNTGV